MIIGLTGTISSGKGTVSDYLVSKGFEKYVFSDVIREETKKRGLEQTRENLQKVGDLLRKENHNEGVLAKKLLEKIKTGKAIVDGIRNLKEIGELRKRKDFFLIGVDAELKLRYERLKTRGREGDPKTFEEFKRLDEYENKSLGGGQEINRCLEKSDFKIINNRTMKELKDKIEEILNSISS